MIKLFKDIKQGEWFKEIRGNRIFIKLQGVLPSGIKVVYDSFEIKEIPEGDEDARHAITGRRCNSCHFNAIDHRGIPGSCPDFVYFDTICIKEILDKING